MQIQDYITVEYSLTQKCYHVSDVRETIKTNNRMILTGKDNRYLIIALCETREEADEFIEQHKRLIKERENIYVAGANALI